MCKACTIETNPVMVLGPNGVIRPEGDERWMREEATDDEEGNPPA